MTALLRKKRILVRVRRVFLRKLFWICLIALLAWGMYGVVGNKILRPVATEQIAQITGSVVHIGSTEFKTNGFVRINSLVVTTGPDMPYSQDILTAKSVEVRFSLMSILRFQPRIKNITLTDFVVNAQYDSKLKLWNMDSLKIKSGETAARLPTIRAKSGVIKIARGSDGQYDVMAIVGVDGTFASVKEIPDAYSFFIQVDDRLGFPGSWVRGTWIAKENATLNLTGRLIMGKSPVMGNTWDIADLTLKARYDRDNITIEKLKWKMGNDCTVDITGAVENYLTQPRYNATLNVKNLMMTSDITPDALVFHPTLLEKIGTKLRAFLQKYKPQGLTDIDLEVSGKLGQLSKSKWKGTIDCKDVTVRYEKFPYQIDDLTGKLRMTGNGIVLDNFRGKHGPVDLSINGYSRRSGAQWDCDINIVSENMLLDEDLYRALNSKQKELWFVFAPNGLSKIDYRFLKRPNKPKDIKLRIDLLDVQAVYQHFPYPLKNMTGTVYVEPNKVRFENVTSAYDGKRMTLNGTVTETRSKHPEYNIVINATDIPIDSTLKTALPASQKKFYDQFDVNALTDAKITIFPNEVQRRLVEYIAEVTIKNASLIYEGFPLPLTDVFVDASLTADKIVIKKMSGRSADAVVTLSGDVWPANDRFPKPGFCVKFQAKQLLLEENMLKSLPSGILAAVKSLSTSGKIDVDADINLNARKSDCPPYRIVIDCLGNNIKYDKFPYPLQNVYGKIILTEDRIELKNITASTPKDPNAATPTKINIDGYLTIDDGDVRDGSFTFHASDLNLDKTLGDALPEAFADFYNGTHPAGSIDVNADRLELSTDETGKKIIDLSAEIILKDCRFGENALITETNARINTSGSYQLEHGLLTGHADLLAKNITIKQGQLENFNAQIDFDRETSTFTSRAFNAQFYGGTILGDTALKFAKGRGTGFVLQLIFEDADVRRILAAGKPPDQAEHYSQGKASGSFNILGILGEKNSSIGRLNIGATDLELAKRSFMGKVLDAMQTNEPSDYIFSDISVDAYLKRRSIIFESIYMSGNSMVMKGTGTLDLNTYDVDLEFSAFGKRLDPNPSFLESLAKGLGSAMITVEISGKFDNPEIKTTTLPVIRSPFNIFGTKN